jgi:hypothetical protein
MPGKVVLTFEAHTREAEEAVRRFARGAQDAFDKVRAGDPILQRATVATRGLTDAKVNVSKATEQWAQKLGLLPGPIGDVATRVQGLSGFLSGPAGLIALAIGAGAAVVTMGSDFADQIEKIDNLSRQTGLSVAAIQSLQQAAVEAGEAPEALVQGFGKLNQVIAEVLIGNDKAAKSYSAIGIDLAALVKSGASTEVIFETVARAIAGIENPTQRAAIQMELFGLRGKGVGVVIDAIAREGLPAYIAKMREAGVVTSDTANEAARRWDEATDRMGRAFAGLLNTVKGVAAQILVAIMDASDQAARAAEDSVTRHMEQRAAALRAAVGRGQLLPGMSLLGKQSSEQLEAQRRELEQLEQDLERMRLMAGRPAGVSGGPALPPTTVTPIKDSADAVLEALKPLQEAVRLANAQFEAGHMSIRDYSLRLQELAGSATFLHGRTVAGNAAVLEFTNSTFQAAEELEQAMALSEESVLRAADQMGHFATEADLAQAAIGPVTEETLKAADQMGHFATAADLAAAGTHQVSAGALAASDAMDGLESAAVTNEAIMSGLSETYGNLQRRTDDLRRSQIETAKAMGDGWKVLGLAFEDEVARMTDSMDNLEAAGREVAQNLHDAFADTFFLAMKGNIEDLEDVWQHFLDAILRMIAEFLAAQAVKTFIKVIGDVIDVVLSEGTGTTGGSPGRRDSGPVPVTIEGDATEQRRLQIGQQQLTIQQQQVDLQRRSLTVEEFTAKGLIGAIGTGAALGAFGGPKGAAAGAATGAIGYVAREGLKAAIDFLAGVFKGVTDTAKEFGVAGEDASSALANAGAVLDNHGLTAGEFQGALQTATESVQATTQAVQSVAPAAQSFASAQATAARAMSDAVFGFSGFTGATAEIDIATHEAAVAAGIAAGTLSDFGGAARDLGAAARDAADAAADASRGIEGGNDGGPGTGPSGDPGGGIDGGNDGGPGGGGGGGGAPGGGGPGSDGPGGGGGPGEAGQLVTGARRAGGGSQSPSADLEAVLALMREENALMRQLIALVQARRALRGAAV